MKPQAAPLIPRRQFLETAAAGTALMSTWASGASAAESPAAADPLRVGLIGCGGYGRSDLRAALQVGGVEIVAVCDVDSEHLAAGAAAASQAQGRAPATFKHHRELLEHPGLQAVIIATPPQWHALQFIDALARGLDVYCEKPLAYDVREGQAMVEAARQSRRVVQIGFQRRQCLAFQQVRDYLREGKAGRILGVEAQIHYTAGFKETTPQAPPASLDWDLWCGPAPRLPYCPQIGHVSWRLEKEYGHGHLVDWGVHLIDAARMILGEGAPRSVQAAGGLYAYAGRITTPDTLVACFEFAQAPLTWRHRIWGAAEYTPEVNNGLFFYGEKETVFVTDDRWVVIPREKGAARTEHATPSQPGPIHMRDFIDAVRARRPASCTPEDAWISTTAVQLAMISYETGSRVVWDAAQAQIRDNPPAARLLKRDYRAPYRHPYAGV